MYIPNASSRLIFLVPLTYSHLTIMNAVPRNNTAMRINGLEATASAIIPQKNEVILKEKNAGKLIVHVHFFKENTGHCIWFIGSYKYVLYLITMSVSV